MIDNSYIQGYIQALRTIQNGVESMRETNNVVALSEFEFQQQSSVDSALKNVIDFIKNQRNSYKELVDKLNKENAK